MKLRDYQQRAINDLYDWFSKNHTGHPVVCLPGGSGKSVVIASVVTQAMKQWPETRILMMVGVKELIAQNYAKLRELWPNAPVGIYSASLGKKCLTEPVTYGGIQSLANKAQQIGHIDLCIIDECHSVSNTENGNYRKLLGELLAINPNMRVVGYTASPYRLGQGMITDGDDALFSEIIEPVTIQELVNDGYLCKLQSKHTALTLDTSGVGKRGGDFVASALEAAVDTDENNVLAVQEMLIRGADRKSWLVFCSGIKHSHHVAQLLRDSGIDAECLTGETPSAERDSIVRRFKSNQLRCMVGVGVFSTGFDHPGVDLIAMLRPTESPGFYLQCAVRGSRPAYAPGMPLDTPEQRFAAMDAGPKPHGCMVLDFAGNIAKHGPITAIQPPNKAGKGAAPTKNCPTCDEIVLLSVMECPSCGYHWPVEEKVKPRITLSDEDIMGMEPKTMLVARWQWKVHTSKTSGKEMLAVSYYSARLLDDPVTEYFAVTHEGYAGDKANRQIKAITENANGNTLAAPSRIEPQDMLAFVSSISRMQPPAEIQYQREGKYHRVTKRTWKNGKSV